MNPGVYPSLLIMCLTVYCIRMLPFLVFRKEITNRWLRSFLYYVPYVTLAVMTFPAIITATEDIRSGIAALIVGLLTAWYKGDLFVVAISCCAAVFITGLIF
ncbi:MAG TPA: branched-chain amino acid transporter [Lachnospiraceae bacterium]|nr:branched-chain amino acid transporter [Lachnospiraceae bacterium]